MNQQQLIERAWALTEQIEAAAADADWTRAAALTEARAPFVMAMQAPQPAEAMVVIRKIQASMEAVSQLARVAQMGIAATYRKSMDNAQKAGRYQQAAWF